VTARCTAGAQSSRASVAFTVCLLHPKMTASWASSRPMSAMVCIFLARSSGVLPTRTSFAMTMTSYSAASSPRRQVHGTSTGSPPSAFSRRLASMAAARRWRPSTT
jgi:hypothetical protein